MIFKPELVEKILRGEKTETRRKAKPGEPSRYKVGRTYAVQPGRTKAGVARLRVLSARLELLGGITEEGARREGFADRATFFDYWRGLYGTGDPEQTVWVIRFDLAEGGAALRTRRTGGRGCGWRKTRPAARGA